MTKQSGPVREINAHLTIGRRDTIHRSTVWLQMHNKRGIYSPIRSEKLLLELGDSQSDVATTYTHIAGTQIGLALVFIGLTANQLTNEQPSPCSYIQCAKKPDYARGEYFEDMISRTAEHTARKISLPLPAPYPPSDSSGHIARNAPSGRTSSHGGAVCNCQALDGPRLCVWLYTLHHDHKKTRACRAARENIASCSPRTLLTNHLRIQPNKNG